MMDERRHPPPRDYHPNNSEKQQSYRGEIFSRHLKYNAGSSYFFNLKENREANIYLNIVESQQNEGKGQAFKRHSILIFIEQRQGFVSECLAALEALAEGHSFESEVKSQQRQFRFQIQKKRHGMTLAIRENTHHYGKPLQEQLQIPQGCASAFSQTLIEAVEKWLECEQAPKKAKKTVRKKVLHIIHNKQHSTQNDKI